MVEIIPKEIRRPLLSPLFILSLSGILFLGVLAGLFLITQTQSQTGTALRVLDERLGEEQTGEGETLQQELKASKEKIDDFGLVIERRKNLLAFFRILEETAHPNVVFTDFETDLEGNTIDIVGTATDFLSLGQQILVWKNRKEITSATLTELALGQTGKKEFGISLSFSPDVGDISLSGAPQEQQ